MNIIECLVLGIVPTYFLLVVLCLLAESGEDLIHGEDGCEKTFGAIGGLLAALLTITSIGLLGEVFGTIVTLLLWASYFCGIAVGIKKNRREKHCRLVARPPKS